MGTKYQHRLCPNPECSFRFPVEADSTAGALCPHCNSPTDWVTQPYKHDLELTFPHPTLTPLSVLLDNIRSIYNVGSILRTADGASFSHLYASGMTGRPDHSKINKTALGAERRIPWSHHRNGLTLVEQLKEEGFQLWGIEGNENAVSLFDLAPPTKPTILIMGNERAGIDPAILHLCHKTVAIPMHGSKESLNVAVAFGIAAYWLRGQDNLK